MKHQLLALLATSLLSHAATTYTFSPVPNSPMEASQLRIVADIEGNTVTITNTSQGTLAPTVCQIYFEGDQLDDFTITVQSPTVSFSPGGSPPKLPGGNQVGFSSDVRFSAGVHTGLDPSESVTFTFSGSIDRIGVHVQQVGEFQDLSASLVTGQIPEPSTVLLGAIGALFLLRRKRH